VASHDNNTYLIVSQSLSLTWQWFLGRCCFDAAMSSWWGPRFGKLLRGRDCYRPRPDRGRRQAMQKRKMTRSNSPRGPVSPSDRSRVGARQIILSVTCEQLMHQHTCLQGGQLLSTILSHHGRLCYIKFMIISSYVYHKLKIPGAVGISSVEANA
jgi:hypothetical protein